MKRFILLSSLAILTACSGGNFSSPQPTQDPEDTGSFLTGRSTSGISLSDLTNNLGGGAGLPVNALLWRAALDVTSILPIDDVDAFSGSIVTEWYSLPNKPNERIKLAIFVLDRELRSDGIRVVVYVQEQNGSSWQDAGIDQSLSKKLEELILTRAREIRAATALQTSE